MVTGIAVMRGAYDGRPYAVNVPVVNDRGALPLPGRWHAVDLARMAILLLLLHLAELLLRLQHGSSSSSTSSF